jgi:hypothetical protein
MSGVGQEVAVLESQKLVAEGPETDLSPASVTHGFTDTVLLVLIPSEEIITA